MAGLTLEQKVDSIVERIVNNNLESYEDLCRIVSTALIEQDRDTRHACAEAVLAVDVAVNLPGMDLFIGGIKDLMHGAVMNCREGIEGYEPPKQPDIYAAIREVGRRSAMGIGSGFKGGKLGV